MRRPAFIASILILALACDKPAATPETYVDRGPPIQPGTTVLFQVFGSRDEPKAAPIAALRGGKLKAFDLDAVQWSTLDSMFFSERNRLPIYRNGANVGTVEVVRGMWPDNQEALYSLPGCTEVVPQATLRLFSTMSADENVEYIATSDTLTQKKPDNKPFPADAESKGRTIATAVAAARDLGAEELGHLEFIGRYIRTGAGTTGLTLLSTFIDPEAGDAGPGAGHAAMVFALAEDSAGTVKTSYQHVSSGEARTVEFQRLLNHFDIDGDGVDEIFLQSWRYAASPYLVVLKMTNGRWKETFRTSLDWCLKVDKSLTR